MGGLLEKLEETLSSEETTKNVFFWAVFIIVAGLGYVFAKEIYSFLDSAFDFLVSCLLSCLDLKGVFAAPKPESFTEVIVGLIVLVIKGIVAIILMLFVLVIFLSLMLSVWLLQVLQKVYILPILLGLIVSDLTYRLIEKAFFAVLAFFVGISHDLFPSKNRAEIVEELEAVMFNSESKDTILKKEGDKDLVSTNDLNKLSELILSNLKQEQPEGLLTAYWSSAKIKARTEYYLAHQGLIDASNEILESLTRIIASKIEHERKLAELADLQKKIDREMKEEEERHELEKAEISAKRAKAKLSEEEAKKKMADLHALPQHSEKEPKLSSVERIEKELGMLDAKTQEDSDFMSGAIAIRKKREAEVDEMDIPKEAREELKGIIRAKFDAYLLRRARR